MRGCFTRDIVPFTKVCLPRFIIAICIHEIGAASIIDERNGGFGTAQGVGYRDVVGARTPVGNVRVVAVKPLGPVQL